MIPINKKQVPVSSGAGRPNKYPFEGMKVKDSFTVKSKNYSALVAAKSWARRQKNGWKFKASFVEDSLTVWRIK